MLAAGVLLGVVATFAAGEVIKGTTIVDRLMAPLALPDTNGNADVIVVLAAGMTAGCSPNLHGIQRVLLAARLYRDGRAPLVLMSGGRPSGGSCTAAEGMRDLAVRLGVPPAAIRVEIASASTWENALRSDAMLRVLGARRILLVTDRPHLRRAQGVFGRFGYDIERAGVPVYLSHADNIEFMKLGLREYAALFSYWWRGYLSDTPEASAMVAPVEPPHPAYSGSGANGRAEKRTTGPVIILGASYALGWTPLPISGVTFVNKGISGQESSDMLGRFETDVVREGARAVIIWGFINDIFRSSRQDVGNKTAKVRENYLAMLARCEAAGITPILATEVTMGRRAGIVEAAKVFAGDLLGKQGYSDYINRQVMDTNAWLREVALKRGLLLLDFESALVSGRGRRRKAYTAPDGSHLTPAAYEALGRFAEPLLREHLTDDR